MSEAYLKPWTAFASADLLRRAFSVCRKLFPLYIAMEASHQLRYHEAGSPWNEAEKQLVHIFLRRCG